MSKEISLENNQLMNEITSLTKINELCQIAGTSPSSLIQAFTPVTERHCNICKYYGFFNAAFGVGARLDAICPKCGSFERQRLFILNMQRGVIPKLNDQNSAVLHFAPEKILELMFRQVFKNYKTADLFQKADLALNIEEINLENESYDVVIANHVLEHVDDLKASMEVSRILKNDGVFVCSVPIIEAWDETYENDAVTSDEDRRLHFGQSDHVRYYGKDFRDRVASGGFVLEDEFTAKGDDVVKHALLCGEKIFVFRKR